MSTDTDIEALKAAVPPGIVDYAWRGVIGTLAYQRNDPISLADAKDCVLRVLAADAEARTQPQPVDHELEPDPKWEVAIADLRSGLDRDRPIFAFHSVDTFHATDAPAVIEAIHRPERLAEQRGMGK